mgnify:CR=1 FL=1
MISCSIGFAVGTQSHDQDLKYPQDYENYRARIDRGDDPVGPLNDLFNKYPALENAFTAQVAYEGVYELPRPGFTDKVPNCPGCEIGHQARQGRRRRRSWWSPLRGPESIPKQVTDNAYTWFDFDCDSCTGVYDRQTQQGYYLRHWNAESPPPSPGLNVSSLYNYSANPNRVIAGGDNQITLAWDNVSETTPDPKSGQFDFRSYRIWKVSGWQRPPGSSGPNDEDWSLLAEYRLYDYGDSNFVHDPGNDTLDLPEGLRPELLLSRRLLALLAAGHHRGAASPMAVAATRPRSGSASGTGTSGTSRAGTCSARSRSIASATRTGPASATQA